MRALTIDEVEYVSGGAAGEDVIITGHVYSGAVDDPNFLNMVRQISLLTGMLEAGWFGGSNDAYIDIQYGEAITTGLAVAEFAVKMFTAAENSSVNAQGRNLEALLQNPRWSDKAKGIITGTINGETYFLRDNNGNHTWDIITRTHGALAEIWVAGGPGGGGWYPIK